jgi:hypothetical protein
MIEKIISGGQTGVDRTALDWAIANGINCGGWCPAGRRAEDGVIPDRYSLQETPSSRYSQRTRWNVRDSDATLIISSSEELSGGSLVTKEYAEQIGRPCLHVYPGEEWVSLLYEFISHHPLRILNVAGPRRSGWGDPESFVHQVLDKIGPNCRKLGQPAACLESGRAL